MYKGKKILCVIPARGGSKRLPGKNIMELAGKPLIAYSIECARASGLLDRIVVSTDDEAITEVARSFGAEVPFMRPATLARDESSSADVLLHATEWLEENEGYTFDAVVLLQVTSPLRTTEDVEAAVKMLIDNEAQNVFSVTKAHASPYTTLVETKADGYARLSKESAENEPVPPVYELNGAVYAWWKNTLNRERPLFQDRTSFYVMERERSVDIDTLLDFKIAETILKDMENQAT